VSLKSKTFYIIRFFAAKGTPCAILLSSWLVSLLAAYHGKRN
jgi:hypothetical protein